MKNESIELETTFQSQSDKQHAEQSISHVIEEVILEMSENQVDAPLQLQRPSSNEIGDVRAWIQHNFTKKICNCFIPGYVGSKQRCSCGCLKQQHEKKPLKEGDENWVSKKHTEELPTDAFGTVAFTTVQQDTGISAEYIRFSDTTTPERVWMLMNDIWELKPPKLLVSILGGNRKSTLSQLVKKSIEEGLSKVLKSADTWLFTGATETPVTALAGQVFHFYNRRERSHRNACIGIAPWGAIAGKEQLLGEMAEVLYMPVAREERKMNCLDQNQTHFLLVDDGSFNRFGIERKFRAALEKYFSSSQDFKPIPTVNLLVCGGYTASTQIKQNMFDHPKIPIVVMKASGGLADVIARAVESYEEKGKRAVELLMSIKKSVAQILGLDLTDSRNVEITTTVKQAVEEHRCHLIIYDPQNDPVGLDHALFQACKAAGLERSSDRDHFSNLQLAILLDEIEVAKNDIDNESANVEYLNKALYKSLKRGKANIVRFLCNYGIEIERFLESDKNYLKKLYTKKLQQGQFLSKLLTNDELTEGNEGKKKDFFDLKIVDRLLTDLMEEDYTPCYSDDSYAAVCDTLDQDQKICALQKLMVWAALNNMTDLVEVFWEQDGKHSLENALVLYVIFKRMEGYGDFDEMVRNDLAETANKFERRALDLLSLYFKENKSSSTDIIKTRLPLWGYKSFLTLAANAGSRQLVAHPCCQQYLTEIWRGRSEKKTVHTELSRIHAKIAWKPRQRTQSAVSKRKRKYGHDLTDHKQEERLSKCTRFGRATRRFFWFLFLAPKGKLFVHALIYTIFLGCFGYLVLVKRGKYHHIFRYICLAMVSSLAIDEFRQLIEIRKRSVWWKIIGWYDSVWNKLDFLAILFFIIGFVFSYKSVRVEKIMFALDLVIWVVKFAQFYRMFKTLGPYLIMIYRMMFHMIGFVLVLIIAVIAYGIFMHALLFPDVTVSWKILFKVLFRPYLLVFGELGINNYALNANTTVFGTTKKDERTEIIVVIGMCFYLLIANVLLLNMLIAVFNNIYEETKENSDMIWRYDKYDMIMEFKNRPCLPIPFSAVTNIPRILFHLCSWEVNWIDIDDPEDMGKRQDLDDFKERCMRTYLRKKASELTESTEDSLKAIKERIESNLQAVLRIEEKLDRQQVREKKLRKTKDN